MAFGIPNIERIVSNFLEGGTGITAIRNVEFAKNFLWVVDFIESSESIAPPEPFNTFFPASDVTFPVSNLNVETVTFGQSAFDRPANESPRDINITFFDDESNTLLKYFFDWQVLDIKNKGGFMSGVKDSHQAVTADSFSVNRRVYPTRQIRLTLLDAYRSEKTTFTYLVYPKDSIDFAGAQASEARTYTISFAVVDDLTFKPKASSFGGFSFQTVLQSIGRFI